MSDDIHSGESHDLEDTIAEQVLSEFVRPLLFVLSADGTWSSENALTRFLIVLPTDGDASIQLNDQDTAWTQVRARQDFAPGEALHSSDFVTEPVPITEASDRFIKGTWKDSGWQLEYKFGEDAARSVLHLQAADEFLASALDDLASSRFRSGFAAAFHAGEHLAKAELLYHSLTAVLVASTKKHSTVRSTYAVWAHLGNSDRRFVDALNWLDRERRSAT